MLVEVVYDAQTIVRATGEIDISNVAEFTKALDQAAEGAARGFIIDLSDTTYIDSAGIQAILAAYAKVRKAEGHLALVVGDARIKRVLEIMRLELLPSMHVCEDLEACRQAFAAPQGKGAIDEPRDSG